MNQRMMSCALAALLSVTAVIRLNAQDAASQEKPAAGADVAARPFAEVSAEWDATDKKLDELVAKYRTAPAGERPALIKEYETLTKKSRDLLPELRRAALAAYEAAPNSNEDVTSTLVGLLANDVRTDHYADALKLGELLLKNGSENPAIDAFVGSAAYCTDDFEKAAVHLKKAQAANALDQVAGSYLSDLDEASEAWNREQALRKKEAEADDLPRVKLETNKGTITVELLENEAPKAVANFVSLVEKGFYDGLTFHRVLAGFMAQAGCPNGTGTGGPGYNIPCECEQENHRNHFRGTLSMAHAGKDTGGSQFFLTFRRTAHLDGRHTVFGRVIDGMDVLAQLQRRNPQAPGQPEPDTIVKAEVLRKRDHEYVPVKVGE